MEAEFLQWLGARLPATGDCPLGLADDAAWLPRENGADLLATVDLLTDGVDFRLAQVDPARVGRKALAVNLSDAAAMAACPRAALVSLALPRAGALDLAKRI